MSVVELECPELTDVYSPYEVTSRQECPTDLLTAEKVYS